jgi:hypothetical protein
MYEHLGVFSWTTEFWDIVHAATGHRCSTKVWYLGFSVEEELAIAKWADANAPELYVPWRGFEHPQLGYVELGGPNHFKLLSNPPLHMLKQEVAPHADFAVYQVCTFKHIYICLESMVYASLPSHSFALFYVRRCFLPSSRSS